MKVKKKIIFTIGIFAGVFLSFGSLSQQAFADNTTQGICRGPTGDSFYTDSQTCSNYGSCTDTHLGVSYSNYTRAQCSTQGRCYTPGYDLTESGYLTEASCKTAPACLSDKVIGSIKGSYYIWDPVDTQTKCSASKGMCYSAQGLVVNVSCNVAPIDSYLCGVTWTVQKCNDAGGTVKYGTWKPEGYGWSPAVFTPTYTWTGVCSSYNQSTGISNVDNVTQCKYTYCSSNTDNSYVNNATRSQYLTTNGGCTGSGSCSLGTTIAPFPYYGLCYSYYQNNSTRPGSCSVTVSCGCKDPAALNNNTNVGVNLPGSCYYKNGCTDYTATNYDRTADHNDGSCRYRWGCTDPSAKNYDSTAGRDNGSCEYCYNGSTDPLCIINFCGDVNDPLATNAKTSSQCRYENPNKTCIRKDELCEYGIKYFCGDVDSLVQKYPMTSDQCKGANPNKACAMTSDQCRAANHGWTCIRNDDLCEYNPDCNGQPYPDVTGEGYECCRPNGTAVGSPEQPCKLVGNQYCRARDVCETDPSSPYDAPTQYCAEDADEVCAVGIVNQCIPDRPNQCGATGDAWCGFSYDVQYTFLGIIYTIQLDTGYWYDPNVQACTEPDIQAILDETFAPLDTPPPSIVTSDGIPITPLADQCPNIAGDQSFDDYVSNGYTREANGDCGCPAGKKMDENYMCVDLTCEDIQTNADNACYDAYYSTYDYDTLVSCMSDATNAYDSCAGFPSCGVAYGSTIAPGTTPPDPDLCSYGTASGVTLNTDTNLYEWTCTAANGEQDCSAYPGFCPDDTPNWCSDHCSAGPCNTNGVCGTDKFTCSPGNPINEVTSSNGVSASWDCEGLDNGTTAYSCKYSGNHGTGGPVRLSTLKVSPSLIPSGGDCNVDFSSAFADYLVPINPSDPFTTCTLSNQDHLLTTFNPDDGISQYVESLVRKDKNYTLKCWDSDKSDTIQSTTGACRVNLTQKEFN